MSKFYPKFYAEKLYIYDRSLTGNNVISSIYALHLWTKFS